MEHPDILTLLKKELSGDPEKDHALLQAAAEKYAQHPENREILRAIGRLMYAVLPEDKKRDADKVFAIESNAVRATLLQVRNRIQAKEFDEAEKLINQVHPDEDLFASDAVTEYFSFNNYLEEVYYREKTGCKKNIHPPPFPFNEYYNYRVFLLFEKRRFDEAETFIEAALKRNPLYAHMLFEKSEIAKSRKDWRAFFDTSLLAFPMLYKRPDLARFFRNIGFYFVERSLWEEAFAAYFTSMYWHPTNLAEGEIQFILQKSGQDLRKQAAEKCLELLGKHSIPLRADPLWSKIAWHLGRDAFEEKVYDLALFFFTVVHDLVGDEEAAERCRECEKHLKKA
ncbi:MAG: hypothetical protein WA705_23755 [Candidatus Ozemobacteraceae bacterium]